MKKLLGVFLFLYAGFLYAADPIVYSRCPRSDHEVTVTRDITVDGVTSPVTKTFTGIDSLDVLPDVTFFYTEFNAPCDLVFRKADGAEKIIRNCTATSTPGDACAALDPTVSFDAKKITYAVFKGDLRPQYKSFLQKMFDGKAGSGKISPKVELGFSILIGEGSHICTYDIASETDTCMPYVKGVFDSGPTYLSNGRIAFTSTRDGHESTISFPKFVSRKGNRIYTMDQNFQNILMNSHYSLSLEQGPIQLKNGRIAFSSWQISMQGPRKHDNGAGTDTLDNLFHIWVQDPDGANSFPIYGQHSGDHTASYFGASHDAAHFLGQTADERIWTADYYRANNNGLGFITGFMQEPDGQEGKNPFFVKSRGDWYVPNDAMVFAKWATNSDGPSKYMPDPQMEFMGYQGKQPWAGKLGHPSGYTDNRLMVVWGRGHCTIAGNKGVFTQQKLPLSPEVISGAGSGAVISMTTELRNLGVDSPGCDLGVYVSTKTENGSAKSYHPSDLELIVDSTEWHEIMPRAVVPYSAIYGVDKPAVIEPASTLVDHPKLPAGTPYGMLGAASLTDRETHPRYGITVNLADKNDKKMYFYNAYKQWNLQGTDTIDYKDEDIAGIRILGVLPNRGHKPYNQITNVAGERLRILGEIPVKNVDVDEKLIIDPSGNIDTSFLVKMPADVPFILQAIDKEGRTLNTDKVWQALKPGEMRTCGGCHVHARKTRIDFNQSFASTEGYVIPEIGRGTVPLIDGTSIPGYGWAIDMAEDIKPIFDEHCISCHGHNNPAAKLNLAATENVNSLYSSNASSLTWRCLVRDYTGQVCGNDPVVNNRYIPPQLTKYMRAFNALGSLLYWKAANKRTDNRTDDQVSDDIDFGADHPTNITPYQLKVISRWIDTGAGSGPQEKRDTQKPTLNIVATESNNAITGLKVGVTDLGSGADVNSASLTIAGNSVDISLVNDGVTEIPLTLPISDLNTELIFRISDLEGNETRQTLTVGFLLNVSTPTPDPDPIPDPVPDPDSEP